jgi:hypothetical protein
MLLICTKLFQIVQELNSIIIAGEMKSIMQSNRFSDNNKGQGGSLTYERNIGTPSSRPFIIRVSTQAVRLMFKNARSPHKTLPSD